LVADGVLEKCSASQGMQYVVQAQRMFPGFESAWCETYGGGAMFVQMVQQNPGVRINPIEPKDLPKGSKGDRQYTFLEPLLSSGNFYISDVESPAMKVLRNYLDIYPNIPDDHAPEWDIADALVALLYGFFDVRARAINTAGNSLSAFQSQRLAAPKIAWNDWNG